LGLLFATVYVGYILFFIIFVQFSLNLHLTVIFFGIAFASINIDTIHIDVLCMYTLVLLQCVHYIPPKYYKNTGSTVFRNKLICIPY